jgi:hypothetical protein
MANLNLTKSKKIELFAGDDSVVFKHIMEVKTGGVVIDVTDYEDSVIKAGHIVIKGEDGYKLMPTAQGAYGTLPADHEYVGLVAATTRVDTPAVGVVIRGTVNENCLPFTMTAAVKTAFKTALPTIIFE